MIWEILTGSMFFWNSSWTVLITAGTWSQSSTASVPAEQGEMGGDREWEEGGGGQRLGFGLGERM